MPAVDTLPLVKVLGPFELGPGIGGHLSPRQRSVVAALVVGEGNEVAADTMVDRVWGDDPPPTARKALQVHVVAVRSVLGADRVATTALGYRLVAARHEIDAWRFEDLVRTGLREPATARAALADALGLWRGTPLTDLGGGTAVSTRIRLEDLHALATDTLADHHLADGEVPAAVRLLESAVLDDPVRERRWAQLMVALYRGGRRADALRAYQRAREALAVTAGLSPGRLLQAVERLVLDDDDRLWDPGLLDDPAVVGRPDGPRLLATPA